MKGWNNFFKDYLNFTRKDRIAVLVIVSLILVALLLPNIVSNVSGKSKNNQPDTSWFAAARMLKIKSADSTRDYYQKRDDDNTYAFQYDKPKENYYDRDVIKGELFYFDPNTISDEDWRRLGLRDKTFKTIQNYLSKGGHFYKPEDLQKIYGLHKDEYERLMPYVRIESVTKNKELLVEKPAEEIESAKTYTSRYRVIDINMADTSAFISLPGIGSKLAGRIVNFRDKLGGFYSIDQIGETFGLPDSTFQKIKQWLKLENASVKKININTATIDELKSHPYIKYSLANPIVAYRNEHGVFSKMEDIKKVMVVTDEIYKKIAPYVTIQ
jgi:competence protein ComEA